MPTFRSAGDAVEVSSTSVTVSYTLTSGDLLLCAVGHINDNAPTSAVWNGSESMTAVITRVFSGNRSATLYQLAGATSGTHDVVVTHASSIPMAAIAFGYSGVDTGTPSDGAAGEDEAAGTGASLTITSPTGDKALVVFIGADAAITLSMTNGTNQHADDTSNFDFAICDRAGTGGSTEVNGTYSAESFGWTAVGANLNVGNVGGGRLVGHSRLVQGHLSRISRLVA